MEINYQILLFNVVFTTCIYMAIPLIIAFVCPHSQRQSKIISIVNSLIIYIAFIVLYEVLGIDKNANFVPAYLYGIINYYILKKTIKHNNYEKNIYTNQNPQISTISKTDFVLVVSLFLFLLTFFSFIIINTINDYKAQLIEKDAKIQELQDRLYLYDYNDYIDSIRQNIHLLY